jgi:hypothetical protein
MRGEPRIIDEAWSPERRTSLCHGLDLGNGCGRRIGQVPFRDWGVLGFCLRFEGFEALDFRSRGAEAVQAREIESEGSQGELHGDLGQAASLELPHSTLFFESAEHRLD